MRPAGLRQEVHSNSSAEMSAFSAASTGRLRLTLPWHWTLVVGACTTSSRPDWLTALEHAAKDS
jgi:hypothetical protein